MAMFDDTNYTGIFDDLQNARAALRSNVFEAQKALEHEQERLVQFETAVSLTAQDGSGEEAVDSRPFFGAGGLGSAGPGAFHPTRSVPRI